MLAVAGHRLHDRPGEGTGHGRGADQHRGLHLIDHRGQIDASRTARPVGHLRGIAHQSGGGMIGRHHALKQQTGTIQRPDPPAGFCGRESLSLQQAQQAIGDAATGRARPEDHDPLIRQALPQPAAGGQNRGAGHTAGALDVVVEAGQLPAVAIEQQPGMAGAEILPVQAGAGAFLLHRRHEFIQKSQIGVAAEPGLPQAGIERIAEQLRAVGAHIQGHRQHPLRVETGAEGVHRQLALADVDAAHPLIADAEDPLRIGDQHHVDRALQAVTQHLGQPPLLIGAEEHPFHRRAVAAAEALDHRPHRGGVDDRQHRLEVIRQKAVKQHQIAAAQTIHQGMALQRPLQRAELLPHPLHLQLQAFHLLRQQPLQPQGAALGGREGRALVQPGIPQQGCTPQAGAAGWRADGWAAQHRCTPGFTSPD